MALLDENRLFPTEPAVRALARELYEAVKDLPIISPHGHTDPRWFAENAAFPNPAQLFVTPDHYVFRMLHSQGIALEDLGVPRVDGGPTETDSRKIWTLFASNYHLFRGTPSRIWVDHALQEVFGVDERLSAASTTTPARSARSPPATTSRAVSIAHSWPRWSRPGDLTAKKRLKWPTT